VRHSVILLLFDLNATVRVLNEEHIDFYLVAEVRPGILYTDFHYWILTNSKVHIPHSDIKGLWSCGTSVWC